ncbi:hypothetical protein VPH35_079904 [Triticum aestivum]|uniref:Endonuclease/exonuclease/phosphatase domain-containing protein n=1 Tax=Aegilops tauschii subsp. strangulata TaxID=200361 RepID=A0A453J2U9_AEGTS
MESFRAALADCGLRDLGYVGDKYTWQNHSWDVNRFVKERLDREVGSRSWCTRFPHHKVVNGDPYQSDHRPIIIQIEESKRASFSRRKDHNFKFEARWLQEEDYEVVVNNAWAMASQRGNHNIQEMLYKVAGELKDWDDNVLGDLGKRIKILKKELEEVRRGKISQERVRREHFLREKLDRLEQQQDMHWKQRAHVKWLTDGDKNTSFFHAFASERKKRNTIKRLKGEDDSWVEGEEPLKEHITIIF